MGSLTLSASDLAHELLAGSRRALARAITLIENSASAAPELLAALYPHTGRSHIIGVTGAPGAGKSTLVNALARVFRRAGHTVGIVAVDPTSPFSGGALLGDRVRMRDLAGDPGIFIRSMATRGCLGGLALATTEVIQALDAAGFTRIMVETVGVGQAEVDVAHTAHTTVVIQAPGLGDEIQTLKAGVLEIADVLVVNKADREGADQVVAQLRAMQTMGHCRNVAPDTIGSSTSAVLQPPVGNVSSSSVASGEQADGSWLPPIVKTVALKHEGIDELAGWIEAHVAYQARLGYLAQREIERATGMLEHIVRQRLLSSLVARLPVGRLAAVATAVAQRELDPYTAAGQLLSAAGLS